MNCSPLGPLPGSIEDSLGRIAGHVEHHVDLLDRRLGSSGRESAAIRREVAAIRALLEQQETDR